MFSKEVSKVCIRSMKRNLPKILLRSATERVKHVTRSKCIFSDGSLS